MPVTEILTESTIWVITGGMALLGVIGTVVPVIPGHVLIFAAALVPWFTLPDHGGLQWWGLAALGAGILLAQLVEFLSGAVGSRWFGGSRWGAAGAFVGGLVGLFFFPIGLFLGPLLGAVLAEWMIAKKEARSATVSGIGSLVGTVAGLAMKVTIALLMAAYLVADILWL